MTTLTSGNYDVEVVMAGLKKLQEKNGAAAVAFSAEPVPSTPSIMTSRATSVWH